jgi:hypothetical protein
MGLHREPSLFKIPEPEAEIRRRVWWCIYIQDRYVLVLIILTIDCRVSIMASQYLGKTQMPIVENR